MEKKRRKIYSEDFRKEKVRQLESGEVRPIDLQKMYGMSYTAIFKWRKKYGKIPTSESVVLETDSEYEKNAKLRKEITKMERLLGRQQMEIDYYRQLIIEVNAHFEIDIEKKFSSK